MILIEETCVICTEPVLTTSKGIPKCSRHTKDEEQLAYQELIDSGLSDSEARGTIYECEK